jgi:hypothetical protein
MTFFEIEGSKRFSSSQSCEACGAKDGTALLSHQTATGITPGHGSSGSMLVTFRASAVRTNALLLLRMKRTLNFRQSRSDYGRSNADMRSFRCRDVKTIACFKRCEARRPAYQS